MIPKIIHYIWLSDEPYPESIQKCLNSWRRQAKGFEIKRWKLADFNQDNFPLFVKQAISQKKWAFACDYLRAYILYKEGGVYLDSDVFMIKNIESYLNHDFVSSIEYYEELFTEDSKQHIDENGNADIDMVPGMALNAAMMASVANHPLLKDVMDYYDGHDFKYNDLNLKTMMLAPHVYALVSRKYGFKYFNIAQQLSEDIYLYPTNIFAESFDGHDPESALVHMCAASWREIESKDRDVLDLNKINQLTYLENRDWSRPYLSIVVLCYKVENYLPQCLESIRRQKFKDYEVIMVDDGSPDRCGLICDAYCKLDTRFKVIHKKNGGIIAARKDALNMARGYWAGSVDGDDWISIDMYKDMYILQCSKNADFIQTGYLHHYTNTSRPCFNDNLPLYRYYEKEEYDEVNSNKLFKYHIIEVSLCRSMLRTEKLRKIMDKLDDNCSLCEDAVCMYVYASDSNSLGIVNRNYYHYRSRKNSCTNSLKSRDVNGLYRLYEIALAELKEKKHEVGIKRQISMYFIQHCLNSFLMEIENSEKKEDILSSYLEDERFIKLRSMFKREEILSRFGENRTAIIYKEDGFMDKYNKLKDNKTIGLQFK